MSKNEALRRQQALAEVANSTFIYDQAKRIADAPGKGEVLDAARVRAKRALNHALSVGLTASHIDRQISAAKTSAELKVPPTVAKIENSLGIKVPRRTKGMPQS